MAATWLPKPQVYCHHAASKARGEKGTLATGMPHRHASLLVKEENLTQKMSYSSHNPQLEHMTARSCKGAWQREYQGF